MILSISCSQTGVLSLIGVRPGMCQVQLCRRGNSNVVMDEDPDEASVCDRDDACGIPVVSGAAGHGEVHPAVVWR